MQNNDEYTFDIVSSKAYRTPTLGKWTASVIPYILYTCIICDVSMVWKLIIILTQILHLKTNRYKTKKLQFAALFYDTLIPVVIQFIMWTEIEHDTSIFSQITRLHSALPVIVYLQNFYLYQDGLWLGWKEKMKRNIMNYNIVHHIVYSSILHGI